MERINWLLILLCLGNLILWCVSGVEAPKDNPEKLKAAIRDLEKELPVLEKTAAWLDKGRTALQGAPEENIKGFINRLQALAKAWKFTLQETAQTGENPVSVSIAGAGNYKAVANLLREFGKNPAVVISKNNLMVQDDFLINTRLEMSVRAGPWKGNNRPGECVEPLQERPQPLSLGNVDLFGRGNLPEKPVVGQTKIRYLGFYSGQSQPTGIIEENLKALLVQPGDKTPSGLQIEKITPDFLEVRAVNERGKPWKIPLEKSR